MRMRRKPWTEPKLNACPYFVERPSSHRGRWRECFPVERPVHLEIGCGKGVSTVRMAHENPDVNYIAVDEVRHVLAVAVCNTEREFEGLEPDNLVFSEVDAMRIYDTFSLADGIQRIYISFPNPWDERAKHHKRRLTHPRQLRQYRDFLAPGGEIWFKTDNDALYVATVRYMGECGFEILYRTDDLHASGFEPNYVSEHEKLYVGQGKPIHFVIARMSRDPECQKTSMEGKNSMKNFFEANHDRLVNFTRVSASVGARSDYVQGGGGNTSAKLEGGLMAIKASGYCLKDIRPDRAYAVLDYEALRCFYNSTDPATLENVEKAGSDEAKANTKSIEGLAALRPSVEAGFHSLLDTYVAHSHSVYANLAACSAELEAIVREALTDAGYTWGWVSYVDPGARLTFSIRDELKRVEAETGRRPAAIFMQNHGLIVHSDDPGECLRIHTDVNNRIALAFDMNNGCFPEVGIRDLGNGLCEAVCPFLTEQLTSGSYSEKFLLESPLYPDQLVFLTGAFSFGDGMPEKDMAVCNPATGTVTFHMPASKAEVIAQTLAAVTFICSAIQRKGYTLSTMGEAARAFIANWESEKYRKSLAGKK